MTAYERIRRVLVWRDSCQCTKLYNRTVITHVAETALPSLDSHDGSLRLNDAQTKSDPETISAKVSVDYTSFVAKGYVPNPVVNIDLPLLSRNTTGLREPDRVNTSREVELSSGLFVSGH